VTIYDYSWPFDRSPKIYNSTFALKKKKYVIVSIPICVPRVLFSRHYYSRNRLDCPFCWNCNLCPSMVLDLFRTSNTVLSPDGARPRIRRKFPCGIGCPLIFPSDIGSRTRPLKKNTTVQPHLKLSDSFTILHVSWWVCVL